jgi:hypothetical protein
LTFKENIFAQKIILQEKENMISIVLGLNSLLYGKEYGCPDLSEN